MRFAISEVTRIRWAKTPVVCIIDWTFSPLWKVDNGSGFGSPPEKLDNPHRP